MAQTRRSQLRMRQCGPFTSAAGATGRASQYVARYIRPPTDDQRRERDRAIIAGTQDHRTSADVIMPGPKHRAISIALAGLIDILIASPAHTFHCRPRFTQNGRAAMLRMLLAATVLFLIANAANAQYRGNYTANPSLPPAPTQPPGTFNDPYGTGRTNPQPYDSRGNFRGNVNPNQYDPNSTANPYGRYGSPHPSGSISNPYGAGSPSR